MTNTDTRFAYAPNGKQVGLNWGLDRHGSLPNPVHPVADSQSGNTMDKGVQ